MVNEPDLQTQSSPRPSPSALLTRRGLLRLGLAAGLAGLAGAAGGSLAAPAPLRLRAAPAKAALVGPGYPATAVWTYGDRVPGPILALPRGREAAIDLENRLPVGTTVHWHGLRIANAMDGVAGLTQEPVEPGDGFAYRFTPPDSGTYWYHSHLNGAEQVARGLSGALIVAEDDPPRVDREEVWLLDDWLLNQQAQIVESFDNRHDLSHAGRIGNSVTLNGTLPEVWSVTAGERIRLRLINAANARVFGLRFEGHRPLVVAVDGQGCQPYEPDGRQGRRGAGHAGRPDPRLRRLARRAAPGDRRALCPAELPAARYRLSA